MLTCTYYHLYNPVNSGIYYLSTGTPQVDHAWPWLQPQHHNLSRTWIPLALRECSLIFTCLHELRSATSNPDLGLRFHTEQVLNTPGLLSWRSWRYHDVQSGSGFPRVVLGSRALIFTVFHCFPTNINYFVWGMFGLSKALHWTIGPWTADICTIH